MCADTHSQTQTAELAEHARERRFSLV